MSQAQDSNAPAKQDTLGTEGTDGEAHSPVNLNTFDSLSSPDGDYSYRQHEELPSPPNSTNAPCQPSNDMYDRELGGFRKYDVDLGDSSDDDDVSGSHSRNSGDAKEQSSETLSSSFFPSQMAGLNTPLKEQSSQSSGLELPQVTKSRGIGKGVSSTTLFTNSNPPRTLATDALGTTASQMGSGGIGKGVCATPVKVAADPSDLSAAALGMAELDLSVPMPDISPKVAAYKDAPAGLNLQSLCAYGSKDWQNYTMRLGNQVINSPPSSGMLRSLGLKRSSSQITCPAKLVKRKRCFANRMQIWSLAELPARTPQHHLTGQGVTLTNGAIEMSSGMFWCISTDNSVLKDMTIKGGCLVVYGKGKQLTLSKVALENCSIIVVSGATATLLQCTMVSCEVALFASGLGTKAEMRGCELMSCRQGVCAEHGAEVALLGLRCTQSTITCIEARGQRTKLTLQRCLIGETKKGRSHEWDVRGVYIHSGAEASLQECALMRATFGLWVEGQNAFVVGRHCKVRNNTRCGVLVAAAASVELHHCMAVGSKEFHGVEVGDESTHAELNSCVLQRNKRCGVVVYEGATVAANACTAEGNSAAAFRARDRARMWLTECTSKNDHSGIAVYGDGALAEASSCLVEGSQSGGLCVGAGGQARAQSCHILACREGHGVDVVEAGSHAQLVKCTVSANKKYAGLAYGGGKIEAFVCAEESNGCAGFKASAGGEVTLGDAPPPKDLEASVAGGLHDGDFSPIGDPGQGWRPGMREAVQMVKAEADAAHVATMASAVS